MFSEILVPLDGSDVSARVLPLARTLSVRLQLPVRLLACVAGEAHHGAEWVHRSDLARGYLAQAATQLTAAGVQVEMLVTQGDDPAAQIVGAAQAPRALVVMSTHGHSGIKRWLLGSVTERVLQSTTHPLLIARTHADDGPDEAAMQTIVVPVDGSALAEGALPEAVQFARAFGASLILVQALAGDIDYYLHPESFGGAARDRAEELEGQALDYLAALAERVRDMGATNVETRLLHGDPATVLLDCLSTLPNHLVVMTTHGRSGLGRWVIGSVAGRLARHNDGPVLILPGSRGG
jgi:nucleotide-binding universal stress UspA family protein